MNSSSVNIKLSKTQISKLAQSCGLLGKLLWTSTKVGSPLTKNVLTTLAKFILMPLRLTIATSVADAEIHEKLPQKQQHWLFQIKK